MPINIGSFSQGIQAICSRTVEQPKSMAHLLSRLVSMNNDAKNRYWRQTTHREPAQCFGRKSGKVAAENLKALKALTTRLSVEPLGDT